MPSDWEIPGAGSVSKWFLCLLPPWPLVRSQARGAWLAYPSESGTRAGMCWCEDGVLRFPAATRQLSSKIKMSPFVLTSLNHQAYSSCCNCLLEKQAIIKSWHGHSILALGIQREAAPFSSGKERLCYWSWNRRRKDTPWIDNQGPLLTADRCSRHLAFHSKCSLYLGWSLQQAASTRGKENLHQMLHRFH